MRVKWDIYKQTQWTVLIPFSLQISAGLSTVKSNLKTKVRALKEHQIEANSKTIHPADFSA